MLAIEFGSRRRGDFGASSDRDLLLIASDWTALAEEARQRSLVGYSVSVFLMSTATYLVNNGSLFFKHIIDEGSLVSGSEQDYTRLCSQWHRARNYDDEIEENLYLLEILNFIPRTRTGCAAAIDIVISSVRNILIRKLANRGEFVFSWGQILRAAHRLRMIFPQDIPVFLAARELKNMYRQGTTPRADHRYLERLTEAADRAFNSHLVCTFAHRPAIRALPERCVDGTYMQLRAIELMCSEYEMDRSLDNFKAMIRQPSYFTANGPNKAIQRTAASGASLAGHSR